MFLLHEGSTHVVKYVQGVAFLLVGGFVLVEGNLELFYLLREVEIEYPLAFVRLFLVGHILLPFGRQQYLASNLNIITLQVQRFKSNKILHCFLLNLEQGRISDQSDRDVVKRIFG